MTPSASQSGVQTGNGQVVLTWTVCQAPTITSLTASPDTLFPANNKMVSIALSDTVSNGCGAVACRIVSVASNEPIDPGGDWQFTGNPGDLTLSLRASRLGSGNGRVYTIAVQCTDASNNSASKTTTVLVPHNK
jgi:hypothetical protein